MAGECGTHCTTTRQSAHGTEVEVRYLWHPWAGETVRIVQSLSKQEDSVLRVALESNGNTDLRELPAWMFDSATCSCMVLAEEPSVSADSLRSLRDLLGRSRPSIVAPNSDNQCLDSKSKGDVDEKIPGSVKVCPTRSVQGRNGLSEMVVVTDKVTASDCDAVDDDAQGTSNPKGRRSGQEGGAVQ